MTAAIFKSLPVRFIEVTPRLSVALSLGTPSKFSMHYRCRGACQFRRFILNVFTPNFAVIDTVKTENVDHLIGIDMPAELFSPIAFPTDFATVLKEGDLITISGRSRALCRSRTVKGRLSS